MDIAAYWVEYIARHGKGSLKAPIVDMPWWQSSMLDIYAFILLVVIILYYTLKSLFKLLKNSLFRGKDNLKLKKH